MLSLLPHARGDATNLPAAFSELEKSYHDALQAHLQATKKYEALKADLQVLSVQTNTTSRDTTSSIGHEDIIALIHRREKLRKLQVLQRTVSIINEKGEPGDVVLEEHIKSRAGEMPLLPATSASRHGHIAEAEKRLLQLKKAVLTAKHTVDGTTTFDDRSYSPEAKLYALQQTRNLLITWIEEQLTIVGDAQAANEVPSEKLTVEGEDEPIPVSKSEIGQIYEQYLNARKRLLQTLQQPEEITYDHGDVVSASSKTQQLASTDKNGVAAAAALPHIASLVRVKAREELLQSQVTAMKSQLAVSQNDTDQLLRRLADESHLVQPGASNGRDWAKASANANAAIAEFVSSRVKQGEQAAKSAQDIIDSTELLSAMFEQDDL